MLGQRSGSPASGKLDRTIPHLGPQGVSEHPPFKKDLLRCSQLARSHRPFIGNSGTSQPSADSVRQKLDALPFMKSSISSGPGRFGTQLMPCQSCSSRSFSHQAASDQIQCLPDKAVLHHYRRLAGSLIEDGQQQLHRCLTHRSTFLHHIWREPDHSVLLRHP